MDEETTMLEFRSEIAHLRKRIDLIKHNRNELFDENVKLRDENAGLKEAIKHISDVLSAAITNPDEIAIDWKEFLLKLLEQTPKGK